MLYDIIYKQNMILYIYIYIYIYIYTYMCECVCVWVYLCICMRYYEEPENSFTKYTFIKQYSL